MKTAANFKELPANLLKWSCDLEKIPFKTSDECKPCEEIIGQERALKAIQTGLEIKSLGYNIFITGMVGTGRTTTIKQLLEKLEKGEETPDDILYVNNFKNPDEPTLITLPAGKGKLFKESAENLIEMLKTNIPEMIKSKYYKEKKDSTIESQQKRQKDILKNFEDEVAKEGFSVIHVQMGLFTKPDLVPLINGKPTPFNKLEASVKEGKFPKKALDELNEKYEKLTDKLEEIFEQLKEIEEETRRLLKEWDSQSITPIILGAINEVRTKFSYPKISDYLNDIEQHLVKHIDLFKEQKKNQKEREITDPFLAYKVNLLIDNSDLKGSPVIMETNPNYINLFGSIELSTSRLGIVQTDFTKIKAGSLLKANGGFLVMNALDALVEPGVWITLKRTLRNQKLEIQNYASLFFISTARLKPQPIKCNVKIALIGDAHIYNLLYYLDEDFKKIFKVKAEFDSEMKKNNKTIKEYAAFIKKISDDDKLKPFDKSGIAAVIEYGTRLAGRQKKIPLVSILSQTFSAKPATGQKKTRKKLSAGNISKKPLKSASNA